MMTRAECLAIAGSNKAPDCEVLRALLATMLRLEAATVAEPVPVPASNRKRGGR